MSRSAETLVTASSPPAEKRSDSPAGGKAREVREARPAEGWRLGRRAADFLQGAALPAAIVLIWQAAGSLNLVSSVFLPTPIAIARAFAALASTGELYHHLGVSLWRAILGFAFGGSAGLLLGVLSGLFRKVEYVLDPSLQVLRLVPHLAVAPLLILWFGFGEESKEVIILIGAFFPLYINTFTGIRQVDSKLFEVAGVLAFSRLRLLLRLIVPAALPDILLGMRLSLAVSWIGLVVAELVGSHSGIGFLINEAKQNSDTAAIFVGIVIFAVVGKLIDSFVRFLERRWLRWRNGYQG
jgi:sulfonate transport system permease protein